MPEEILPVKSDEVLLDIWYNGYADPFEMAELGFGLVNVACSQFVHNTIDGTLLPRLPEYRVDF